MLIWCMHLNICFEMSVEVSIRESRTLANHLLFLSSFIIISFVSTSYHAWHAITIIVWSFTAIRNFWEDLPCIRSPCSFWTAQMLSTKRLSLLLLRTLCNTGHYLKYQNRMKYEIWQCYSCPHFLHHFVEYCKLNSLSLSDF